MLKKFAALLALTVTLGGCSDSVQSAKFITEKKSRQQKALQTESTAFLPFWHPNLFFPDSWNSHHLS